MAAKKKDPAPVVMSTYEVGISETKTLTVEAASVVIDEGRLVFLDGDGKRLLAAFNVWQYCKRVQLAQAEQAPPGVLQA